MKDKFEKPKLIMLWSAVIVVLSFATLLVIGFIIGILEYFGMF